MTAFSRHCSERGEQDVLSENANIIITYFGAALTSCSASCVGRQLHRMGTYVSIAINENFEAPCVVFSSQPVAACRRKHELSLTPAVDARKVREKGERQSRLVPQTSKGITEEIVFPN